MLCCQIALRLRDARLVSNAADGLVVRGDRLRLEQALGNLVDNALRHGAGTIELSATAADGAVALHVRDGGPGFPPEFLGAAFERFTRADPARGARLIGLADRVEALGGRLELHSPPGAGTSLLVVLPFTAVGRAGEPVGSAPPGGRPAP